jgi:hypothetical protein
VRNQNCIKRRNRRATSAVARAAVLASTATILTLISATTVNAAAAPPNSQCRPASKVEYNSAKKQFLLRNRFGMYVRTGWVWRRHYWYCQF